jgi:glutathione S-transferase
MAAHRYRLIIGSKNWSSWSLRPWLAMRHLGVPFEEVNINLRAPDRSSQIAAHSPSGKVPVLMVDDHPVWESLGILETLADAHPDLGWWPKDRTARALARSVANEMHAGFADLRLHCPMDFLGRAPMAALPDPVAANVRRIVRLWSDCRAAHGSGGPFLFGAFSIADAMYAPVVSRFVTYLPDLGPYGDSGAAALYVRSAFAMPEMKEWAEGAAAERAKGWG